MQTGAIALAISMIMICSGAEADIGGTWKKLEEQTSTNLGHAAEKVTGAAKTIEHQTKVNSSNLAESANDNAKRLERQIKTNLKHAAVHVARDGRNLIRWIEEDKCDRVGRKKGPDAKRRCEAQQKIANSLTTEPAGAYGFYAAIQVDCMKYENDGTDFWGTQTIQIYSTVSKADARTTAMAQVASKSVCSSAYGDERLVDGTWRWISM
jgi:hypothetical protein